MENMNKLTLQPKKRPKMMRSIIVSFSLFGLILLLYMYNPYYLMRPLQIREHEKHIDYKNSNLSMNKIGSVNNKIFDLIGIPNSLGHNYSVTRESRMRLFLKGNGNCAQQATGMGLVLDSLGHNYSIIHFLPKTGLLEGNGHSIVNFSADSIAFLVDPLLKMLPIVENGMSHYRLMHIEDLSNGCNLYSLSNQKTIGKLNSLYYDPVFASAYAEVDHHDINNYFNHNKTVIEFLRLDEGRYTRIFINAIAAITFKLPTFKVTKSGYINICGNYPNFIFLKYLAYFFILNTWCLILMVFIEMVNLITPKMINLYSSIKK